MRVCIIRNAENRTNASITRVVDAVLSSDNKCILLTRNRYGKTKRTIRKTYTYNQQNIDNYEINIKTRTGRGLLNLFQLIFYQLIVFIWLIRHKDKYDIIHAFDLDAGIPTLIVSKVLGRKYIYHVADFYVDSRGGIPAIFKKAIRQLEYFVINNAETTILCTKQRRKQISGSNPKKVVVVHNVPVQPSNYTGLNNIERLNNSEKRTITLTYVGGLTKNRFIKNAIDEIKNYPNLELKLAGMGGLEDYAKKMSLDHDNIHYYGKINYNEALELYSKTDIMFSIYNPKVPNHRYSAPNKLYEAMLFGKPIIVAKSTGVDTVVEKENMGFVIEYSSNGFREVLELISRDKKILDIYGRNASRAYNKYSWEEMRKRLVKVYKEIKL